MRVGPVYKVAVKYPTVAPHQPPLAAPVPDEQDDGAACPTRAVQPDTAHCEQQHANSRETLDKQRQIVAETTDNGARMHGAKQ